MWIYSPRAAVLKQSSGKSTGVYGYLEKGIQTPSAQGRSTQIIAMIKWIRTSRLSINNSLSVKRLAHLELCGGRFFLERRVDRAAQRAAAPHYCALSPPSAGIRV